MLIHLLVVRPIENPAVDTWATQTRGGPDYVIRKHGAYRDLVRSVRDGWWVYIVGDQNAGLRGIFVPFFGLEASTWETVGPSTWRAPVSSSIRTTPKDQTSERRSAGEPAACSGLI